MPAPISVGMADHIITKVVATQEGCWEWQGCLSSTGYGCLSWKRKTIHAHRASWLAFFGPIGSGLFVCHRCDNKKCVNPSHLFLGTRMENIRDWIDKGHSGTASRRPVLPPSAGRSKGTKIGPEEAAQIIRLWDSRKFSQGQIAERFGVSQSHVCRIISGVAWNHSNLQEKQSVHY